MTDDKILRINPPNGTIEVMVTYLDSIGSIIERELGLKGDSIFAIHLELAPPKDWKEDMQLLYNECCGSEEVWGGGGVYFLNDIRDKYGLKDG